MITVMKVTGMTCQNCVRHVTEALLEIPGVESVTVSLENATASIQHQNASSEKLRAAVEEAGYTAEKLEARI